MNSLVVYSDSEEGSSDEDPTDAASEVNSKIGEKRKKSSPSYQTPKLNKNEPSKLLPLPDTIKSLFEDKQKKLNDPDQHDGRIRSFEHVEGNWATHVSVIYEPNDRLLELIEELLLCLRPLEFKPMQDFHLSLSRTVVIRHHWIKPLQESLQRKFSLQPRCCCEISSVKLYSNDEKTRSFLALTVTSPADVLQQYIKIIDDCFEEYKLQKYYKNPSFHISIAWCLGDVISKVPSKIHKQLQDELSSALEEHPDLKVIPIEEIVFRTGNKQFSLSLQSG